MTRRAFTLIEILVTISIIVILAAMVLIATRSITTGARTRATHTALDNCKSLLAEYDTVKRLNESTQTWAWWDGSTNKFITGDGTVAGPSIWLRPGSTTPFEWLDAPGYIKDDSLGVTERNGSRAVLNTTIVMAALAAIPANREALSKLPQDQVLLPEWTANQAFATSGADRIRGSNDDGANDAVFYPIGCRVKLNGVAYRCIASHAGAATFAAASWSTDSVPAPILKDGWGNPIIYVPGSGLGVRLLNGQKANTPTDVTQNFVVVSPEGHVNNNGTAAPVVTRVGRPFFASAGPDGDFSKGDDNVYSFEQ